MPNASEIKEQLTRESRLRGRLGVPAVAGGALFFLSGLIVNATVNGRPSVGLMQGLTPALRGQASTTVSPSAAEVKYISHHAFALLAGATLKSISLVALTLTLFVLADATRFRRRESWPAARPLVLYGGLALAVINVAHQVTTAVKAHSFALGHDFGQHAVEQALTKGTVNVTGQYLDLLAALALTVGMIAVCVNAIRTGLLVRWMGMVGIVSAVLIILPIGGVTLEIVPAFWLVAMGILFTGRWPGGELEAWSSGEARPWPSQAELRARREGQSAGEHGADGRETLVAASGDVVPAPAVAERNGAGRSSRKRRGRRRAR